MIEGVKCVADTKYLTVIGICLYSFMNIADFLSNILPQMVP